MRRLNRQLQVAMALICVIALFLFSTGVYHLTHHGHPSGIIELSLTALLCAAFYLILKGA